MDGFPNEKQKKLFNFPLDSFELIAQDVGVPSVGPAGGDELHQSRGEALYVVTLNSIRTIIGKN